MAFEKNYLVLLNMWLKEHKMPVICLEELPKYGLIVQNDERSLAMGFVRMGEGVAILDSIITNPNAESQQRNLALDVLFLNLLQYVKTSGIKTVMGSTRIENMKVRAEKFGFKQSDQVLMVKED